MHLLEEDASGVRQQLKASLSSVLPTLDGLRASQVAVSEARSATLGAANQAKAAVMSAFDEWREMLQIREEELLAAIDTQIDTRLDALSRSQAFVSNSLVSLSNAYRYTTLIAHTVIGGGSDVQVLDVRHLLLSRLGELAALRTKVDTRVPSPTFASPPSASLQFARLLMDMGTVHESFDKATKAAAAYESILNPAGTGGNGVSSSENSGIGDEDISDINVALSRDAIKRANTFIANRKSKISPSSSSPPSSSFLVTLLLMALLHGGVYWLRAINHPMLAHPYSQVCSRLFASSFFAHMS